jgi:predicted deacylase
LHLVKRCLFIVLVVFVLAGVCRSVGHSRSAWGSALAGRVGSEQLGRSEEGRPIVALRAGDPQGTRVLVFGCIHGTECAGIAVARALERAHAHVDLWIVPDLNPDGYARGTRQNGRGVDLNANGRRSGTAAAAPGTCTTPAHVRSRSARLGSRAT